MEDLKKLLEGRSRNEPAEIRIIKEYVQTHFKSDVKVTVQPRQIVVLASSAALAGSLRMHGHHLTDICKTDKRLVIRIG